MILIFVVDPDSAYKKLALLRFEGTVVRALIIVDAVISAWTLLS